VRGHRAKKQVEMWNSLPSASKTRPTTKTHDALLLGLTPIRDPIGDGDQSHGTDTRSPVAALGRRLLGRPDLRRVRNH
jgi:hypothetical protein